MRGDGARRAGLHPRPGLNAAEAERQARAEEREDRIREREAAAQQKKGADMAKRATPVGDKVAKFPSVDPLREQVAGVMQILADAFDDAEKAKTFNAKLSETSPVDPRRFPLGGGQ